MVTKLHSAFALSMLMLAIGTEAEAQSKDRLVQCRIESGGKVALNGPCRFMAESGGSFGLENADRNKPLLGDILTMSVSIISPDAAEVRGLTRAGINSRWGEARRAKSDPACWDGSDFRICAR
ncbi:hypothetical protein [Bradyrhizobium sp. LHD-71]|uniref:hypothetical protein n=1 Tax=Bradyrhizobium sp. LHD-71 TaxID=3072141 RepID=UPI00280FB26A|nr:hypothetical protein [Bradyrhizobium sp. LHD-71]MDQ8730254.1 hypothetical protein [Bradyrhizobium sp. LHD-71]